MHIVNFDLSFKSPDQIVDHLYDTMKDVDRKSLMSFNDSIALHHTFGRHIRNEYGLWHEDNPHMKDKHPDDVSDEIIKKLMERVRGFNVIGKV